LLEVSRELLSLSSEGNQSITESQCK